MFGQHDNLIHEKSHAEASRLNFVSGRVEERAVLSMGCVNPFRRRNADSNIELFLSVYLSLPSYFLITLVIICN
jgi:hypothetical protein